jgi:hypothetical protein
MNKILSAIIAAGVLAFSTTVLAGVSYAEINYGADSQQRVHVHPATGTNGVVKIAVPADAKPCAVGSVAVYEHDDGSGLAAYPNSHFAIALTTNPEAQPTNYGFSEKDIYVQVAGNCKATAAGNVIPQTIVPGQTYYIVIAGKPGTGRQASMAFSFGVELRKPQ